jgi:hypothetical protein
MKWEQVLDIHTRAVAALTETAEKIPPDRWLTPLAEGKWTPGHILEHLNLTYDTLQRELDGGRGMAVVTKLWQRMMLRVAVLPKLLRSGAFPAGARAPREIRPVQAASDKSAAVAAFRERATRFASSSAAAQKQGRKLSHAYFGMSGMEDAVLLCARHIEHHEKQLRGA